MVSATQNLKGQTQRQKDDSERIKTSLQNLKDVANQIQLSVQEQNIGSASIVHMVESIKSTSADNKEILIKLDKLIQISSGTGAKDAKG